MRRVCFIRLLLWLLSVSLCGSVLADNKGMRLKNSSLKMTLTRGSKGSDILDLKFRLEIRNTGTRPVKLDGRLLNPVLMAVLTDGQGNQVSKIPPSVPRPLEESITVLKPKEKVVLTFSLSEVTMDELKGGSYIIWCCYDPRPSDYPAELGIYQSKICSNRYRLSHRTQNK